MPAKTIRVAFEYHCDGGRLETLSVNPNAGAALGISVTDAVGRDLTIWLPRVEFFNELKARCPCEFTLPQPTKLPLNLQSVELRDLHVELARRLVIAS